MMKSTLEKSFTVFNPDGFKYTITLSDSDGMQLSYIEEDDKVHSYVGFDKEDAKLIAKAILELASEMK